MKTSVSENTLPVSGAEKKSENLLIEKMGMSIKEIREIYLKYEVTASQMVEIMQLSKYQFVYSEKLPGQCEPCMMTGKIHAANF